MLTTSSGALLAEDTAPRPVAPIPQGETEARYRDQSQIPPQLMQAIKDAWCTLHGWLPEVPVHVFRIEKSGSRRTIALAPCSRIVLFSKAFIFDRPLQPPRPMAFPIMDVRGGIGMSFSPGHMTWDEKDQVLYATWGTDLCPSPFLRYTYRFEPQDQQAAPLSWVLLKAEVDENGCYNHPNKWVTFWEAPSLSDQRKPK